MAGGPATASKLTLSPLELSRISALIIEPDAGERNNMRTTLRSIGIGNIADAPSHAVALKRFNERKFSQLLFEAKRTNYTLRDWLIKILEIRSDIIAVPRSSDPNVDDVFDLLVVRARGFLVKRFTIDTMEQAMIMATKQEPMADGVLNAKDRNEALVSILLSSLDKTATGFKQAQQLETVKRELPMLLTRFPNTSKLAKTFAKGDVNGLLETLERVCLDRSNGSASRLGRLRKRLSNNRVDT